MRAPHAKASRVEPNRLTVGALPIRAARRCCAKNRYGKPCSAAPLRGKKRCAFHSGNHAVICGQRGGRRRAVFNPDGLEPFPPPKDARDLLRLVMQTVIEVRAAKMDTKTATAIFYGCGVGRAILEAADFDSRLKALEERHEALEDANAKVN